MECDAIVASALHKCASFWNLAKEHKEVFSLTTHTQEGTGVDKTVT